MERRQHPMNGTAVIYARYSCSRQREASIDDQLRVCRQWCEREGYEVVATYSDYAMSGRTDERPEFQRMIAAAGESDIVLVYMMDRFSRDPYDAPIYKRELERHGVRLVSALESIPDSPEGILYEKLLEGLAAAESAKTSVRSKRGMHGNALKCMANGVPVFGYRVGADGRYEVDEHEAAMVRDAFVMRAAGESYAGIAQALADRGVRTSAGRPCSTAMVTRMLRSMKYRGTYEFGDVRVEGGMPAIVDASTWDDAQATPTKSRGGRGRKATFPLAGRVTCAVCGGNMGGTSGHGRGGKKYRYYRCPADHVRQVNAAWLESETARRIREALDDDETAMRIAQAVAAYQSDDGAATRREAAQKSLREADRGLQHIQDAIEQGLVTPGMRERIGQLTRQRDTAEAEIARIDAMPRFDVEDFVRFLRVGATLDDAHLLDAFVHQAIVSDEQVIVVYNYSSKEKVEPAHDVLVRLNEVWLPRVATTRTEELPGFILFVFPRVA
ncbi:MAG: recombinase family protein [Coriobacteriales bacterium]|nr:recombinase family protein [Coriobacteriales bacterium]